MLRRVMGGFTVWGCLSLVPAARADGADGMPGGGAGAGTVAVTFSLLHVPAATPTDAALFLAGSFNGWRPDDPGSRLLPGPDGSWLLTLRVEPGTTLELKVTRGSWDTVEKGPRGEEMTNRFVAVEGRDAVVRLRVAAWRDQVAVAPTQHTVSGDVTVIDGFHAPQLGGERRVWVYLPPGYRDGTARYPVLYMHDGQNVFDSATSFAGEWQVDETLDRLCAEDRLAGLIVVAVDNGGPARLDEYSPWYDGRLAKGGRGEAYSSFLVETLKPFVDSTFRTHPEREHTGIAGSSMGGLISLYAAFRHPEVFSRVAALSPSLDYARGAMLRFVRGRPAPQDVRVWLDIGGRESGLPREDRAAVDMVVRFHRALLGHGMPAGHVRFVVDREGMHNEFAWAKRFPEVVTWLFAP